MHACTLPHFTFLHLCFKGLELAQGRISGLLRSTSLLDVFLSQDFPLTNPDRLTDERAINPPSPNTKHLLPLLLRQTNRRLCLPRNGIEEKAGSAPSPSHTFTRRSVGVCTFPSLSSRKYPRSRSRSSRYRYRSVTSPVGLAI